VKGILGDFAGGVVIIVVAAVIGVAQNTVRSNPVPLIQKTAPVVAEEPAQTDTAAASEASEASEEKPVGEIALSEAKALFDSGIAVFIDARAPEAFADGHIPGAINIPYDQLPQYLETLQNQVVQTDLVVCYCWGPSCDFSEQLGTELRIMQYKNVKEFTGGWEEWTAAGYPTEKGM
jgi:rhodanese-related sulfurtransferase